MMHGQIKIKLKYFLLYALAGRFLMVAQFVDFEVRNESFLYTAFMKTLRLVFQRAVAHFWGRLISCNPIHKVTESI